MKNRIVLIGILSFVLLGLYWATTRHGSTVKRHGETALENAAPEIPKGPHGGKLFTEGDFGLEVTIYEEGVPPEFRVYPYWAGKPLELSEVSLRLDVNRFGGVVQKVAFKPEAEYLKGDVVIYELHSFDVDVIADHKGKPYRFQYSQREARTAMSDEAVKAAGIGLDSAGPRMIKSMIDIPGEVHFNRDRMARVVSRLSGIATQVTRGVGDSVRRGEILAILESRDLADAAQRYLDALRSVEVAEERAKREESLWKRKISSEAEYRAGQYALREEQVELRAAEQKMRALGVNDPELAATSESSPSTSLTRYTVRSPIDGVIVQRSISNGEEAAAGTTLFSVADLSQVWVEVPVYARHLSKIKAGQTALIRSDQLDKEAVGTIAFVGSVVDIPTRAATARIVIDNPNREWRPGLYVNTRIVTDEVNVPIAVKKDAIQVFRDWNVVYQRYGKEFEGMPVETGLSDDEYIEVVSGLKGGEVYAAVNSYTVKADVAKSGATHDH